MTFNMDSSLKDTNLFLLKRSRDLLRRNAEYKEVESSAKKTYLSLNDAAKVGDDDVCIVTNDLPPTDQRAFVQYLAEHVRKDSSKVYVYAGYRFNYTKDGAITPVQKITRFDRRPFVARYRNNDNKEELVDVFTGETFACSGRVLNDILGIKQSGTSNEVISVACAELDIPIVCILPKRDWSGQPSRKSSNEVIAVFDTDEHATVFSYKGWGREKKIEALSISTEVKAEGPSDPESVAVIITTHNRTETAKTTIESLVKRLKYPKLHWFIADDRSEPGHVQQLVDKFVELGIDDVQVTETNAEHWGLGASLNNALTAAFKLTDVVLTTEDDWYLQYDFDISEYVRVIKNNSDVCTIRLGAINTIQDCIVESEIPGFSEISLQKYKYIIEKKHRKNMMLNLQVALRHSRLFKRTGLYPENKNTDVVEYTLNSRYIAYAKDMKILWPSSFDAKTLCNDTNPFLHFGVSTVGHKYDRAAVDPCELANRDKTAKLVVSLTSIPRRIHNVKQVLSAMLEQTMLPDLFVLYLNTDDFRDTSLPEDLIEFSNDRNNRTEIRWVNEDWTSHTKYIFALKDFPNAAVINIDDDLIYENHFIENLVNEYNKHRNERCLICNFSREIVERNKLFHVSGRATGKSGLMYRPLTGHGTLYPPGVFDNTELFDHDKAMRLTYKHDEWWLWYVCYKHGIPVINTQAYRWDKNTKGQHQVKILDQSGCLYFTVNNEKREDNIGKDIYDELQKEKNRKYSICVVMTATKNMAYQYKYTTAINKLYCAKHGYDFFFEEYSDSGESCHYLKKDLILKYMDKYDWVMYLDVDAWFNDFDKGIEEIIDKGILANKNASLIVAKHSKNISKVKTYDLDLVNAGVLLVKNTNDSRIILDDWHFRTQYAKDWLKTRTSLNDQPYLCMSIMFNPHTFKNTAVLDDTDMNYFTNRVPPYSKNTYILHASGSNYNNKWKLGMYYALVFTIANNNLNIPVSKFDFC